MVLAPVNPVSTCQRRDERVNLRPAYHCVEWFRQGQSLTLIAAELVVMVVVGISLFAASFLFPYRCYRWIYCDPAVFTFYLHICLLFLRTNAAMVSLPFYLQTVLGRSEVETVYF